MVRKSVSDYHAWTAAVRLAAWVGVLVSWTLAAGAQTTPYTIVDTAQVACYDNAQVIQCPAAGQPFYGQDAEVDGTQPSYTVSADGLTVYDNNTGLTWQKSPDTNGDGALNSDDKLTWAQAQARPAVLNAASFGGFGDWRVPTIKEIYSLIDYRGTDPDPTAQSASGLTPFINTQYFDFVYGDVSAGERIIDAQYWSATTYVSTTMNGNATQFGVNFADGRIKGYPSDTGPGGSPFKEFLRCVRGNPEYGTNLFADDGDGTITDSATGLVWSKGDSGVGMEWQDALAWAQTKNAANYLGHADWRLPNAKELQSIVDYTLAPDVTDSAALDPLFDATPITNEGGQPDYAFYWASTTHASANGLGTAGIYVAFGRALGWMEEQGASCYTLLDVHGAGAQRSDPKSGSPTDYVLGPACSGGTAYGRGPQGDVIRIDNFVRLVRGAGGGGNSLSAGFTFSPSAPTDATSITFTASASGGAPPYTYGWDICGASASGESVVEKLSPGSCAVALTVTDSSGGTATVSQNVVVGYSIVVSGAQWLSDPARLKVSGSGFDQSCQVKIGGVAVRQTVFKGATLLVAKEGGMKAMVPKGATVQITVVSADGRSSAPFSFTR